MYERPDFIDPQEYSTPIYDMGEKFSPFTEGDSLLTEGQFELIFPENEKANYYSHVFKIDDKDNEFYGRFEIEEDLLGDGLLITGENKGVIYKSSALDVSVVAAFSLPLTSDDSYYSMIDFGGFELMSVGEMTDDESCIVFEDWEDVITGNYFSLRMYSREDLENIKISFHKTSINDM